MTMQTSKVVVVTGSTRGIGYGLASEFLKAGCKVVVCGRSQESTDQTVGELAQAYSPESVCGRPCNVRSRTQVQALWDTAWQRFGHVDIWINNAGLGTDQRDVWMHSEEEVAAVVDTNITGTIHGAKGREARVGRGGRTGGDERAAVRARRAARGPTSDPSRPAARPGDGAGAEDSVGVLERNGVHCAVFYGKEANRRGCGPCRFSRSDATRQKD